MKKLACFAVLSAALFAGCGKTYSWRPAAPLDMRTVAVPTFRNETEVQELGALMSGQLLREFQREGTFSVSSVDEAALEVQGVVKKAGESPEAYDRRSGLRFGSYEMTATVLVSVVDKRNGRVLVNDRPYTATATFVAGQDMGTARRDASGRLADDLARQVVDDVTEIDFGARAGKRGGK